MNERFTTLGHTFQNWRGGIVTVKSKGKKTYVIGYVSDTEEESKLYDLVSEVFAVLNCYGYKNEELKAKKDLRNYLKEIN